MVLVAADPTARVVTVNRPLVLPAGTVTEAGTVAAETLLLVSATATPPDGAAPVSVTVPAERLPPVTLAGLTPTLVSASGVTVSVAVWLVPL